MDKRNSHFQVAINIEEGIPGDVLIGLLAEISQCGSISRGAEKMGLSYRYAWGLIKKAESSLDVRLLIRQAGGSSGGGAELTEEAVRLLSDYQRLYQEIKIHRADTRSIDSRERDDLNYLVMATTLEPVETGLLSVLEEAFHRETGIIIRHIPIGSGQALRMAQQGRVDIVFSHAPELEQQFIQSGRGAGRYEVMHNPFVLIGPNEDLISVKASGDILTAMSAIAKEQAMFITRGDLSGTSLMEQHCWKQVGVDPKGNWYKKSSLGLMGNMGVIKEAAKHKAYALVDRATFIISQYNSELQILVVGSEHFSNPFSLVTINPDFLEHLNHAGAKKFISWMVGESAQKIISDFGKGTYGQVLFYPK